MMKNLFFIILIAALLFLFIPVGLTYATYGLLFTSKDYILNSKDEGVVLLDRDNKPFFTFYDARIKKDITLSDIPLYTQQAAILSEDKEFYSHGGFSVRGIVRAVVHDVKDHSFAYGGSTITQQLAKNTLLSSQKSIVRKYQELIIAQELERRFSKQEILEMYLNTVYFGDGAYGIEEAANIYFNKPASKLTIAESVFLISLLPSPSTFTENNGESEVFITRQKMLLKQLLENNYITPQEYKTAQSEKLLINASRSLETMNTLAPHFALYVKDELIKKYGEEKVMHGGFRVRTTLRRDYQEFAEKVVKNQVRNLSYHNVTNGAAVVLDPTTGEVLSMVGSKDWFDEKNGKVNMAVTPRQVGSSFKPIVYATALDEGVITLATPLKDEPTTFANNYKPKDYDGRYRGVVTPRRALSNSLNIPSVQVMSRVGVSEVLSKSSEFGITTLSDASDYGPSLVLGTGEVPLLELTNAYSAFANNGIVNKPTAILEVKDKYDSIIYSAKPESHEVISSQAAFLIASILSDPASRSEVFGNVLNTTVNAAVKTGTTESYKDALTVGFTPQLVVGVWVGNNNNVAMDSVAGSLGAAPAWKQLIEEFSDRTRTVAFTPPDGIVKKNICINGIGDSDATASAKTDYFVEGSSAQVSCSVYAVKTSSPSASMTPTPTPTVL